VVSTAEQPSLKASIINDDSFVSVYTLKKNRMEIEEKCSKVRSPNEKNILSTSQFVWGFLIVFALSLQCYLKALCTIQTLTYPSFPGPLNLLNLSEPQKWVFENSLILTLSCHEV